MTTDFLADFLKNPAKAKLLRVLVSNEKKELSVPSLTKLTGVGTKIVLRELKSLEKLGMVKKAKASARAEGEKNSTGESWVLDRDFRHVRAVVEFIQQTSVAELKSIEQTLKGSGRLSAVVLSGVFVGDPTRPADLLIAGSLLNERRLEQSVRALELMFGREIRYAAFSTPEFRYRLTIQDRLIRDTLDFPHRILVNKEGIF